MLGEISDFLKDAMARAQQQGIPKSKIIIDPGIGFGKTISHNLLLIRQLQAFADLDVPVLIGPSRKAFIRTLLRDEGGDDIAPDLPIVETGTQASVAAAVLNGVHIVRVHDVANTRATVRICDAIKAAQAD
jgi:dihydropteroate synthase